MSLLNLLALGESFGIAGSLFGNVVGHRLLTGVLSLPDYEALRPYKIGRFYPIKAKNSTEIVPADVVPHPAPLERNEVSFGQRTRRERAAALSACPSRPLCRKVSKTGEDRKSTRLNSSH